MSRNQKWLTYWKSTLQYADIKPIELINEPVKSDSFTCIESINPHLAKRLWKQARAKASDNNISIIICPVQSRIHVNQQFTDSESECLFWIEACMNKDGKLSIPSPYNKPFFIRDFLSPNPKGNITLASVEDVDKAIESFKFDEQGWSKYWYECNHLFKSVTGKSFDEFNTFDKAHYYIEVAPLRGISRNIINLYKSLLEDNEVAKNASTSDLISSITSEVTPKKQDYPFEMAFKNLSHVGQFDGQFPLSYSQRISMRGFTTSDIGEVIAINGPPGTGKTTLLQSIVANITVQRVLEDKPPALIVASSTNNQAITNILAGFKLPENDDLLTDRWLPDIPSLGLYMSGKNSNDYLMYNIDNYGETSGFFQEYEARSPSELKQFFIEKCSIYFNKTISSIDDAKKILKQHIIELNNQVTDALNSALKAEQAPFILQESTDALLGEDNGFNDRDKLEDHIKTLKNKQNDLNIRLSNWKQVQEELYQSYDRQSILAKLFRFLPIFKQRRATQFRRIITKLDDNEISVTDWSNHFHIIERIDLLLTELNTNYKDYEKLIEKLLVLSNDFSTAMDNFQSTVALWDSIYRHKLDKLYKITGDEYQNLDLIQDINIRLDISWRFESFWLALHFREAEYIELLQTHNRKKESKKDKRHNEFGKETYKSKLQRFACLTPIFISTFHTLPKMTQYYNWNNKRREPNYELYDYLIVDEAGQVSVDVAIPSFSLAKNAVVVGDTLQIEPIYSITEPMDSVVYQSYIAESSNIDENEYEIHSSQGKLSSSGSLMSMAQHANKYHKLVNKNGEDHITDGLLLTEHRRCLDSIISYSNDYVYYGELEPMRGDSLPDSKQFNFINNNVAYVHIEYASESSGNSRINKLEAGAIAYWINEHHDDLVKGYGDNPIHEIIAVVTPYKTQALEIKARLASYSSEFKKITVGTVHSLQGAERPIVLFSVVISPQNSLMFLNSKYNLLNVAISRAKDYFVVFGNMNVLSLSNNTPLGNLGEWLLDNKDSEIDNSFVYKLIGFALNKHKTEDNVNNKPTDLYYSVDTLRDHINDVDKHERYLTIVCRKAEKELFIASPYLSIRAISDNLRNNLAEAVERGVSITVYFDPHFNIEIENSEKRYKKNADEAIKLLQDLGVDIRIMQRLHAKTILLRTSREPVLIEGSFNWLSAVRDKSSKYHRYEASVVLAGERIEERYEEIKLFFSKNSKPL